MLRSKGVDGINPQIKSSLLIYKYCQSDQPSSLKTFMYIDCALQKNTHLEARADGDLTKLFFTLLS